MKEDIENIINEQLDGVNPSLEEVYNPPLDEIEKLVDEQNQKMVDLQEEEWYQEMQKRGNMTTDDTISEQEEVIKEALKQINNIQE